MSKKNYMQGYRGMLRDRMQPALDLALRRCGCKNKYIEYIYNRFLKDIPIERRSLTVKQVLGLKKAVTNEEIRIWMWKHHKPLTQEQIKSIPPEMKFHTFNTTIDWNELELNDPELYDLFLTASGWVTWFKIYLPYIYNDIKVDRTMLYKSEDEIREELKKNYNLDIGTINFILKTYNNE